MTINYLIQYKTTSTSGTYQLPCAKTKNDCKITTAFSAVREILAKNHSRSEDFAIQYDIDGSPAVGWTPLSHGNTIKFTLRKLDDITPEEACFRRYSLLYTPKSNYKLIDASEVLKHDPSITTVLNGQRPLAIVDFRVADPAPILALQRIPGIGVISIPNKKTCSLTTYIVYRTESRDLALEFAESFQKLLTIEHEDISAQKNTRIRQCERILSTYQTYGRFLHYTSASIEEFGKHMTACKKAATDQFEQLYSI